MTTVREAAATKPGNPLCGKLHAELALRGMLPAIDNWSCGVEIGLKEVAA